MDRFIRSKVSSEILEEACAWFVECRAGDLDDEGRRELDLWLRKSPEHLSSYIEIAAIWNEGPLLDPAGKWPLERLIDPVRDAADNVVSLANRGAMAREPTSNRDASTTVSGTVAGFEHLCTKSSRIRLRAIAASIVGGALLAGSWVILKSSSSVYATDLGEQRSIQFDDGSMVELDARSKMRVRFSKRERDVELIEGQALFHVAHDSSRPFIVAVGAARVRAVGTQFDVDKRDNGAVVTVVEGRVALYSTRVGDAPALPLPAAPTWSELPSSPLLAAAGEQVTVSANAAQKTAHPNIAGATAWRERQVVFDSATLGEVAEEFNRYNRRQLVVDDPQPYGFHISGVFSSTDLESLLTFLRERPGVKIAETASTIRIERSAP